VSLDGSAASRRRVRCTGGRGEWASRRLIQEPGDEKSIEAKRAELAAVPEEVVLSAGEVEELRAIGDNTGSMVAEGRVARP
jgi:hypothetical protein